MEKENKKNWIPFGIVIALEIVIIILLLSCCCCCSDKKDDKQTTEQTVEKPKDVNVSILLDLSDRITPAKFKDGMTPLKKDITIISYIDDWFLNRQKKNKFIKPDKLKIFIYPKPNGFEKINETLESLSIDMERTSRQSVKINKERLKSMSEWPKTLESIYETTIKEDKFVGSDIWGFFDQGDVTDQCIKDGARNILIILTDGYIYDKNNRKKDGDNYSYIVEQTLDIEGSGLIPPRHKDKLDQLEVLVLECNASSPEKFNKMRDIMENWFNDMGVKKCKILKTDVPSTTKNIIADFLKD